MLAGVMIPAFPQEDHFALSIGTHSTHALPFRKSERRSISDLKSLDPLVSADPESQEAHIRRLEAEPRQELQTKVSAVFCSIRTDVTGSPTAIGSSS